jgi:hypothetical protein
MAPKPKTGGAKNKAKPRPKEKDEKQFERFIEAARTLGVDETGAVFEKTFKKIAQKRRAANPKPP